MELHNNRVGYFCRRIKSQQSDLAIKIPVHRKFRFPKKNRRWFASFFRFFLENWISQQTGIFIARSDCWDLICEKKNQNWQSYSTFVEKTFYKSSHFQQMLNNFVGCEFFSPYLQGLKLVKNALIYLVGMLGDIFLWLVARLEQWPFM